MTSQLSEMYQLSGSQRGKRWSLRENDRNRKGWVVSFRDEIGSHLVVAEYLPSPHCHDRQGI